MSRYRFSMLALPAVPMSGAAVGALLDERLRLGFTTWRTVCRDSGFRLSSVIDFTWQLLPLAVAGLLIGGLVVLAVGLFASRDYGRPCLAAHAGCALTLPVALLICVAPLPLPMLLAADFALASLAALLLLRATSRPSLVHP